MMQLTPSGWIGVLIGIVVFGSIVGTVTAATNCPSNTDKQGTPLTVLADMITAFTQANYAVTSACTGGNNCIQYYPPPKNDPNRKGKATLLVECATACVSGLDLETKMKGKGYRCTNCDTDRASTTCKFITDIQSELTECYFYNALKTTIATPASSVPKHLCMDECHYFYASPTDFLTVGCQDDIKTLLSGVTTTKCPAGDPKCEKMISLPLCFAAKGSTLKTVEDITKAMARENWKVTCGSNEKCIQYYPPSEKARRVGKAMALLECGAAPVSGAELTTKIGDGYLSHACDASSANIKNCKTLQDVKSQTVDCYDYTGDRNNADEATLKRIKIYCMDKCRFVEAGKTLTVGCADDLKTGSPTDCPDTDISCEKMIKKSDPNPTTGPNQNPTATTKPKHGNRVTVPTCLIGSMAILLFAASRYVTILN